jgi:hypothetical protein
MWLLLLVLLLLLLLLLLRLPLRLPLRLWLWLWLCPHPKAKCSAPGANALEGEVKEEAMAARPLPGDMSPRGHWYPAPPTERTPGHWRGTRVLKGIGTRHRQRSERQAIAGGHESSRALAPGTTNGANAKKKGQVHCDASQGT